MALGQAVGGLERHVYKSKHPKAEEQEQRHSKADSTNCFSTSRTQYSKPTSVIRTMFSQCLTIASLCGPLVAASPFDKRTNATATFLFNAPKLTPFMHIDLSVAWPVNATTGRGIVAQFPNAGGMSCFSLTFYENSATDQRMQVTSRAPSLEQLRQSVALVSFFFQPLVAQRVYVLFPQPYIIHTDPRKPSLSM